MPDESTENLRYGTTFCIFCWYYILKQCILNTLHTQYLSKQKNDETCPALLKPLTSSKPAFTSSKLTTKTLEQGVK